MRILICNDDGIHAPGIAALVDALRDRAEVWVVAPESERSAVGHAITIYNPLKTKEVFKNGEWFGFAVDGTPADCVKLAVSALLPEPPDLVVSGINLGLNAGISVIYSGTVSAATEGIILGIPSVAISLCTFSQPRWETPQKVMQELLLQIEQHGIPPDTLLNVNVPNIPYEELKGLRTTRMGRSRFVETFERRSDPRGNAYYWMDGEIVLLEEAEDTDLFVLKNGYASLTPLGCEMTRHEALPHFISWNRDRV